MAIGINIPKGWALQLKVGWLEPNFFWCAEAYQANGTFDMLPLPF